MTGRPCWDWSQSKLAQVLQVFSQVGWIYFSESWSQSILSMTTHQGVAERDCKMLLECSLLEQKPGQPLHCTAPVVRMEVKRLNIHYWYFQLRTLRYRGSQSVTTCGHILICKLSEMNQTKWTDDDIDYKVQEFLPLAVVQCYPNWEPVLIFYVNICLGQFCG